MVSRENEDKNTGPFKENVGSPCYKQMIMDDD